jgi:hypothetical protein
MNRSFTAAALASAGIALLAGVTASTSRAETGANPVAPVLAETYYRCPSGYTFRTNGSDSAHCKRAAYTTTATKPLADCPNVGGIGTFARTDYSGTRDMCVGTNPITGQVAVERGCWPTDVTAGYTKRIVSGTDRCEKTTSHPADIRPPSVAVTR